MKKLLLVGMIMLLLVALPGCGNGDDEGSADAPSALDGLDADSADQSEDSEQTSTGDDAEETSSEDTAQ